jgi:hypothetical protein
MNISEIYKKITGSIGRIVLNGREMSESEFAKLVPEEKVKELSKLTDTYFNVPKTPIDELEEDTHMLTQDDIRDIPVAVDFVAVPSSFDIDLVLSMREGAGMFDGKETNLEHVKFVAETVAASPFTILSKTPDITVQSAFFCLEIFRELGLTIDSNYSEAQDSKFRGRKWEMESKHYEYQRGHIAQSAFLIVIVNVYRLIEEGIMDKVSDAIDSMQERVDKMNENMEMLDEK